MQIKQWVCVFKTTGILFSRLSVIPKVMIMHQYYIKIYCPTLISPPYLQMCIISWDMNHSHCAITLITIADFSLLVWMSKLRWIFVAMYRFIFYIFPIYTMYYAFSVLKPYTFVVWKYKFLTLFDLDVGD